MRDRKPSKVVGLIGYPLGHTISPAFQQAAFDYHSLPIVYEAWETPPDSLGAALDRVRRSDCLGMNVTIPHKEAIVPRLDSVDDWASQIGAVNTVVNDGGRLHGYNTDAAGFLRALRERGSFEVSGKRVVLVGAGGVARAVVLTLAREGASSLTIANRSFARAEALAEVGRSAGLEVAVLGISDSAALGEAVAAADLLVNATSVGMWHATPGTPVPAEYLHEGLLVHDLIYNPAETILLGDAARAGARVLNGLSMLVYQGAAAFELWTHRRAPVGLMMARAEDALARLRAASEQADK